MHYYCGQIEGDYFVYSMHGRLEMLTTFKSEKHNNNNTEVYIKEIIVVVLWLCKYDNENSGSIKHVEFFE